MCNGHNPCGDHSDCPGPDPAHVGGSLVIHVGGLVGIAAGSVVIIAIVVAVIVLMTRRRRQRVGVKLSVSILDRALLLKIIVQN